VVTLGVTGGIGSGKTTACRFLAACGAYVFDADQTAKKLLDSNLEVQQQVADEFGQDIIKDGKVDTAKLAQRAFVSEISQRQLNDILHPRVIESFQETAARLSKKYELIAVDAPLIFESGFESRLDHTLLIYTKYKFRLERALRRGNLSREEILRRMDLQMPEEDKRELATFVIENNGTEEQLKIAIGDLYKKLTS